MLRINAEVESELHVASGIQAPFTAKDVAQAAASAKALSAPGEDRLPYESVAFAHPSMILRIAALFSSVLASGDVPEAWKTASVWMLAKPGKDHSKWDGFRGISLTSVIIKLFERCLLARLSPHFDPLQSPLQMGFRKAHSRDDATLCLAALTRMGQTKPGPNPARLGKQYAAFIDVRRAFPSVPHDALFTALYDSARVGGRCFRAIRNLFDGLTSAVSVGEATSDPYDVVCGTREGAILSPWLYSVFIDYLLQQLAAPDASRQGTRASVGPPSAADPIYIPCIAYADDLVLVATSAEGLQDLLDLTAKWANDHLVQFAREKTKVVVFDGDEPASDAACDAGTNWSLPALFHDPADPAHSRINQSASYVYLGTTFHHSRRWSFHNAAAAADYRSRIAPSLVERGIGAFGAGGAPGAAVWSAVGAAALDKGAAVTAAANVTTGGLADLEDEWRHAAAAAIGGRSSRCAAATAIAASTGFRLTSHRREEALAKAIQRWDALPARRHPPRIMAAARSKAAMGQQWFRAATAACANTSVPFPAPAAPLPRYNANKIISAQVRARQAAERAKHDRGKSHMSLFNEILDRQREWGAPACVTAPFVSHPAGLGYSIHRQFATATCRLNALDFGAAANNGACSHPACANARETPEHVVRFCSSPAIAAARAALLAVCGLPSHHPLSHDDFIAVMAFDARFAPNLGFLPSHSSPSFERAALSFFRAIGSARFGAGASIADKDRPRAPPAPPPAPSSPPA